MKNDRYYYSNLPDDKKNIYHLIYQGIKQRKSCISFFSSITFNEIHDVYMKVLYDNPSFFYVNQSVINGTVNSTVNGNHYSLMIDYLYSDNEINLINNNIQNLISRIRSKCKNFLSDKFRIEKNIHDSIIKSVTYDYDAIYNDSYRAHSIVGVFLDKKAVCEGISKAFKLLCNEFDIKCAFVMGEAQYRDSKDLIPHGWNLIKIGDESYFVDVTWDLSFFEKFSYIGYDYFNLTAAEISKEHHFIGKYPLCFDEKLNYFYYTNSLVQNYHDIVNVINKRFDSGAILFKLQKQNSFSGVHDFLIKSKLAFEQVALQRRFFGRKVFSFNEKLGICNIFLT